MYWTVCFYTRGVVTKCVRGTYAKQCATAVKPRQMLLVLPHETFNFTFCIQNSGLFHSVQIHLCERKSYICLVNIIKFSYLCLCILYLYVSLPFSFMSLLLPVCLLSTLMRTYYPSTKWGWGTYIGEMVDVEQWDMGNYVAHHISRYVIYIRWFWTNFTLKTIHEVHFTLKMEA